MKYIDYLASILIPISMLVLLFGTGIWIVTEQSIKTCNDSVFDELTIIFLTAFGGYPIVFRKGDKTKFILVYIVPCVIGVVLVSTCYLAVLI